MKLSVSNTFDVSQIADTQTYQEIQPFFDYFNQFTTDIVQGFNNGITFADNLKYFEKNIELKHGTAINIGKITPVSVFFRSTSPILSYKLSTNNDSTKNLIVYFKETQNILAKSATWIAGTTVRYQVQNISAYSVGDVVRFSEFGTAANNGTYLIVEIDSTNSYVYVLNHNRTSATGDETKTGYGGEDLVKYSITLGVLQV